MHLFKKKITNQQHFLMDAENSKTPVNPWQGTTK